MGLVYQATKNPSIISFHNVWQVQISITAQYNSIYVITEQIMTLTLPPLCLGLAENTRPTTYVIQSMSIGLRLLQRFFT